MVLYNGSDAGKQFQSYVALNYLPGAGESKSSCCGTLKKNGARHEITRTISSHLPVNKSCPSPFGHC
jgi:hypothetical protein